MTKIMKAYTFRMYPTLSQKELLEKSFGTSRYIYNYFLGKNHNYINKFQCVKELPELVKEKEWMKEIDSCLLRTTIFNLEDSFKRYSKGLSNYPKFKSKQKSRKSYRTNNITSTYKGKIYNSIEIDLENKTIKLPKLKDVKIKGYRNLKQIKGRIINATIYKEANKYYVSVCVEEELTIPVITPIKAIGLDVGIKEILTTSDGITLENRKYIQKYEDKIKGLNKWLASSTPGSKNRYKIIKKLQTVYKKLKNARKYYLHTISNEIVKENDIITCEKLKITKMTHKSPISKQIYDASWYELIKQLEYKSKWKGKIFYQVDTYYPSSQLCHHCGYQEKNLKDLSIRNWKCKNCSNQNERDINASINILWEGIKMYFKNELQAN